MRAVFLAALLIISGCGSATGSIAPSPYQSSVPVVSTPSSVNSPSPTSASTPQLPPSPTSRPTPGPAWTRAHVRGSDVLLGVSCPSSSFCAAVDQSGNVVTSRNPTGGAAAWTLTRADFVLNGVSCPSADFCAAVGYADRGGNVVTSSSPTGGVASWTATNLDPYGPLTSVSCPTSSLCVAVGGGIFTSTNPTGGAAAWTRTSGAPGAGAISCPSSSLCVGVGGSEVVTSTDPTGGAATWEVTHVNGIDRPWGVSCAASGLCVVVDQGGNVATSTNPTGGASAWKVTNVVGNGLRAVSCPDANFCVAVDDAGDVVTSSNPAGGADKWAVLNVDDTILYGVSCPSSNLCVAVDYAGNVVTSTSPLVPLPTPEPPPVQSPNWVVTNGLAIGCGTVLEPTCFTTALSCPGTTLCVAGSVNGNVITSVNPTGGASAWKVMHVDGSHYISSISCPNTGFCAAVDDDGNVVISTNPTQGGGAWTVTHINGSNCAASPTPTEPPCSLTGVSCPSSGLCVATRSRGDVVVSSNPTGGAAAWNVAHVDANHLAGVSCPSTHMCVAVDTLGNAVTSTNPTGGQAAWKTTHIDGTDCYIGETSAPCFLFSVSCPVVSLCVAVDGGGNVVTSTRPTAGAAAWKVVNLVGDPAAGAPSMDGVSCPSTLFCIVIATSAAGDSIVLTTNNPTGAASAWRQANSGGTALMAVSCADSDHCVVVDQWGHVITSSNPGGL